MVFKCQRVRPARPRPGRPGGGLAEELEHFAAQSEFVARQVCGGRRPGGQFAGLDQQFDRAVDGIDADHVALADQRNRAAIDSFRRDMDRRWHLARGARKTPVGEQGNLLAAILQDAEHGQQLVQFRHAVGLGALEADDGDEIAGQVAGLEGGIKRALVVEDLRRRLDDVALRFDGGKS